MAHLTPAGWCAPCANGEHADDGTGDPCPCCGADCPAIDDDAICLCDAYRADLRPGRCPIHGKAGA